KMQMRLGLSRAWRVLFGEDMMMSNQLDHRSPKRKERDNEMKTIRIHGRGGPERLVYEDVPQPHPGQGEVLVGVYATGVIATELEWDETYETAAGDPRA